ncbi:MAG: alpha/beta hydrolase [Proteobacteria bacterium]|nr:alpha/beta hydrolase [Pseudomonadota bacterium]
MWAERIRTVEAAGSVEPLLAMTLSRFFSVPIAKAHPDVVKAIATRIRTTPALGYLGCSHAIPKINVTARLKEILCPTLIIVGRDDPGTPVAMSEEIHQAMPGSKLVIIPDAAHLANLEQPDAFNDALSDFLAGADNRS